MGDLIAADDSEMLVMSMLHGQDAWNSLGDGTLDGGNAELFAGPFAHVVVDEAQELTDAEWQMLLRQGIACVIGDAAFPARRLVHSLNPELSKGLEFDLVVLIEPEAFGTGIEEAVDRYVAMTRATERLVVLTEQ